MSSYRKLRRALHEGFSDKACKKYEPLLENRAAVLVAHVLESSDDWPKTFSRFAASIVLGAVYNWPPIDSKVDPVVDRITSFFHVLSTCEAMGAYLVDIFPTMLYLPSWMAKWKRDGEKWFRMASNMFEEFYEDVRLKMVSVVLVTFKCDQPAKGFVIQLEHPENPCFAAMLIHDNEKLRLTSPESVWLAGWML